MMTRLSIRRADRIITPTHIGKEQVLDYFGLPEEKVEVIHFGLNKLFLEPCVPEDIDRVKQKHGITGDYILTVGDLHPRKSLARIIEAFNWLKETRKIPHSLVLAGKGLWQAEQIQRKASACSASDSIIFTGYIPLEEVRALYQGAAVFAFPSLDEGFGLPVHEAMASRVPVIVSDRGALPDVAGGAAISVNPLSVEDIACAMFRVLDSQTLREELVKKGLKQIEAFSWDEACRKTMRLYQDVYSNG
jgi:alpha-1,3-rhamnosyl/mannosyltransferase